MKIFCFQVMLLAVFQLSCQRSSGVSDDSETVDTNSSLSTETSIDTQTVFDTGLETESASETETIFFDSGTPADTASETIDTSTGTGTLDTATNDTETEHAGTETISDDTHAVHSDTGTETEEEFVPDCEIGNYGNTILFEGYEYKYFFYGYFVGMCVESLSDCKGVAGRGEIHPELSSPSLDSSSCAPTEDCCLQSCTILGAGADDANRGWCQRPEQYCHGGISEPSADCGGGLVCCSGIRPETIYLPPCKFDSPPTGYLEVGWCILPEQKCAYGTSDQQSTCEDGQVCCPSVEN